MASSTCTTAKTTSLDQCASPGCTKLLETKLACPKCIQLGLPHIYFCTQACFKANYASHNKIHKLAKQIMDAQGYVFEYDCSTFIYICVCKHIGFRILLCILFVI